MVDEEVKCENCGTPLMDLERRLERDDNSHRHHPSDCARILKGRVEALNAVIDAANEALFDSNFGDVEHYIECHADTLPTVFRSVAAGHAKALAILQVVIHERFE